MADIEVGTRIIATTHEGQPHGVVKALGTAADGRAFATCRYDSGASSIRWVDELVTEDA